MDRGHVIQSGTYEYLLSRDGPFAQFLMTYLLREDDDDVDDAESNNPTTKANVSEVEGLFKVCFCVVQKYTTIVRDIKHHL